jgi:hypothetical protein
MANMTTEIAVGTARSNQRIAPMWHTVGLLLLVAFPIIVGVYRRPENFPNHAFWRFSIPALVYEWCLAAYVVWGLRRGRTTTLRQLVGGRWNRVLDFFRDLALGIGFLIVAMPCMALVIRLLGGAQAKGISVILPRGLGEMAVWFVPTSLAIVFQAAIFGAGHTYEGMKMVVAITVFGILAGALAVWRRSLRPNMIGHAMMDILAALVQRA